MDGDPSLVHIGKSERRVYLAENQNCVIVTLDHPSCGATELRHEKFCLCKRGECRGA